MAIKPIVTDPDILQQKSEPFDLIKDGYALLQDMLDTANSHTTCVGLAAVQIGVLKNVILVKKDGKFMTMINPKILVGFNGFQYGTEGCLSVEGVKTIKRHRSIRVKYTDMKGRDRTDTFHGFAARIIQHEVDHLHGVTVDTKEA